ncbi:MAG: succinyl-diaminopimelate desuccinylase [Acidimicrobiia bacterium]|nr:succinyl-diaminopimelate desuccinylase [Acidimicrobiia bacterium]
MVELTAELIGIPSVSRAEGPLADRVEAWCARCEWLELSRIGHNVVARTTGDRPLRLLVAGHLDTVPSNDNSEPILGGDRVAGLGAADMKGGLAVMMALAAAHADPAVDVTYVWYAAEEIAREHSGLLEVEAARPDLLRADAAVLGEPTGAVVEAGCQGTMRLRITLAGERAHTARPWMGTNAVHRLGGLLEGLSGYVPRCPVVDGCRFREALQATSVSGGVAGNVVPDEAALVLNHRFAPDRSAAQAEQHVRGLFAAHLAAGDAVELLDMAPAAAPRLDHPLLAAVVAAGGGPERVRAKLGWTDVAFFAELGIPALNFGPGDAELAHTAGEYVTRDSLESTYAALSAVIAGAAR